LIEFRRSRLLPALVAAVYLLSVAGLLLTGWQLRSHSLALYVWAALVLLGLCLAISWQRSTRPKAFELIGLLPTPSRQWRARLKGRAAEFDIEIVNWTRVGSLLGLDITSAEPHIKLRRFILVKDQCSNDQWRELLASLNWLPGKPG
jgi:hypothetical protein